MQTNAEIHKPAAKAPPKNGAKVSAPITRTRAPHSKRAVVGRPARPVVAPDPEPGSGARIEKMKTFVDFVQDVLVKETRVYNEQAALPKSGRPMVVIVAHGPGLAWVPLIGAMGRVYLDHGLGDKVVGIYFHPAQFWVPGLRKYYEKTMGTPSTVGTVKELVEELKSGRIHLTGTAPEGASCVLSWDEYVGPLRSGGMVSAAIEADADICLIAHQGGDDWNIRVNLPFGWKIPLTRGIRGVNIALPPITRLEKFSVSCQRYRPSFTSRQWKDMDRRERRLMLGVELDKVRARLNLMTDELKECK